MGSCVNHQQLFIRQDEYKPEITDIHQRSTHALSYANTVNPYVSEFLFKSGKINIKYPDNKKFAVCITHDIDQLFSMNKDLLKQALRDISKGSILKLSSTLSPLFNKRNNPYYNIRNLLEIEKSYDANSTFFFLALGKKEIDFNYDLDDVKDVFKAIKENDSEIGLHAGHLAFNDLKKLSQEKRKLEDIIQSEVIGIRNHFLKFRNPDTWEVQCKAGFKYDVSYGFNDATGFRNGMCHPFNPYNVFRQEYIDIIEIPLTLMDCTLDRYMQLDFENSWKVAKSLIDKVEQTCGVFCLLWHNTYFFKENLHLYLKILDYCQSKDAWLTSGEKIFKWWKENNIKSKFYEDLDDG